MLFAKVGQNTDWPWWIYSPGPMLLIVFLPPFCPARKLIVGVILAQGGRGGSERAIEWDAAESVLTLRFDTEAPDFPLPVQEMYGGWAVEAGSNCAAVIIGYEYTVPVGLLGEFVASLVAPRFRGMMETAIATMEAEAKQTAGAVACA